MLFYYYQQGELKKIGSVLTWGWEKLNEIKWIERLYYFYLLAFNLVIWDLMDKNNSSIALHLIIILNSLVWSLNVSGQNYF